MTSAYGWTGAENKERHSIFQLKAIPFKRMTARSKWLCFAAVSLIFLGTESVAPAQAAEERSPADPSSEYQIGPENALQIDVYYGKNEKISQKVRVSSAGIINFPLVGEVAVAGLTVAQLQEKLKQLLEKDYLVNPQVTAFIEEYSTVTIMGEVKRPGAYEIKGRLTVVGLISLAEGFTENALPTEAKVIRAGPGGTKTETLVRIHDVGGKNAGGENEGMSLRSGDVVVVPKSTVTIMGEVKRPGSYPTKGRLTVTELIALAEGFSDNALPTEAKVIHTNPDGTKKERVVRLSDILNRTGGGEGLLLETDDVVIIPKSTVTITGEVKRPGSYPTKGRLTVVELIALAEGFSENASPNEVKVIRTGPDGTRQESRVRVKDILSKNSGENEGLLLKAGDVVIVPESTVTIMGEVEKPGSYPTKGRLTVIELVALAEGFSKIAAPNRVKVIHTTPDGVKEERIVRVHDMMNKDSGQNESLVLQAGDVVIVPESLF
ncbi:MAG: SLBB domain-containing protein [Candidatus Omnitrophica bacterium]|nr:SLBB domain-containing protein [Candidatus Omnitrophota bacterium]